MIPCPREDEWLELAVGAVPPPRDAELHAHRLACAACHRIWTSIAELTAHLAAPPLDLEVHVDANVAALMGRVAGEERASSRVRFLRRASIAVGGLAAAAALMLFVSRSGPGGSRPELEARGGGDASVRTIGRHVGFRLFRLEDGGLMPLQQGDSVDGATAFTGSYRNIGDGTAHLLVFAVDARGTVHWLYPAFTDPATDPRALSIGSSPTDAVLPTSVRLAAPALGRMRVLTLTMNQSHTVSEIESLPPSELSRDALARRFAGASVDELSLEVMNEQRHP